MLKANKDMKNMQENNQNMNKRQIGLHARKSTARHMDNVFINIDSKLINIHGMYKLRP